MMIMIISNTPSSNRGRSKSPPMKQAPFSVREGQMPIHPGLHSLDRVIKTEEEKTGPVMTRTVEPA